MKCVYNTPIPPIISSEEKFLAPLFVAMVMVTVIDKLDRFTEPPLLLSKVTVSMTTYKNRVLFSPDKTNRWAEQQGALGK